MCKNIVSFRPPWMGGKHRGGLRLLGYYKFGIEKGNLGVELGTFDELCIRNG